MNKKSNVLKCNMKFAAYLPKNHTSQNLPVLIWLSGEIKSIFK